MPVQISVANLITSSYCCIHVYEHDLTCLRTWGIIIHNIYFIFSPFKLKLVHPNSLLGIEVSVKVKNPIPPTRRPTRRYCVGDVSTNALAGALVGSDS